MEEALALLPSATFLPPAGHGDVVSALTIYQPDAIGIIDGVFGQSLSVWHKEILFALHRGVRVVGAASMGALRAAEMETCGMEGVGEVYRLFHSGELTDDDEVALVHADSELGFRALSEPMVNVRATVRHACAHGLISELTASRTIDSAKRLHFSERTLARIIDAARLSTELADGVAWVFRNRYVDVKASDARLLLEALREDPAPRPAVEMVDSGGFTRLYNEERRVRQDGSDVPLRDIASYAALTMPDFDDLNFGALNRALVQVLAQVLGVDVTPDELDAERVRFRRRHGLIDQGSAEQWRRSNHVNEAELDTIVHELAVCRRLHRWLLGTHRAEARTRWLLDELRLRGRYVEAADGAAHQRRLGGDASSLGELRPDEILDLVEAQRRATGWQPDVPPDEWVEEAPPFASLTDLAHELLRLRRVREDTARRTSIVGHED